MKYELPNGWDLWSPAIRGAFRKGLAAHRSGAPITACPYEDKRKPSGRVSWSRSFINAWRDGYQWSKNKKEWDKNKIEED